jgi:cyanophycin synthetase
VEFKTEDLEARLRLEPIAHVWPPIGDKLTSASGPADAPRAAAELLALIALQLQKKAGSDASFSAIEPTDRSNRYDVTITCELEDVGSAAVRAAAGALSLVFSSGEKEFDRTLVIRKLADIELAFRRDAARLMPNYYVAPMVEAARARAIPWSFMINDKVTIRLGHGRFQKRLRETLNGDTSAMAAIFARSKIATLRLLSEVGLPVSRQRTVGNADQAVTAAGQLGYPVVVKPADGKTGQGVHLNLRTAGAVRKAYANARRFGRGIIVEAHAPGSDHRMLVLGDELIAVSKRTAAHVVGDGIHTVLELVDIENKNPRRGVEAWHPLRPLTFDQESDDLLAGRGYDRASIPAQGEQVFLRRVPIPITGGTALDVTDIVHEDNRLMAIRATQTLGLNVSGIDFVCTDISRSFHETGAVIVEINAYPSVRPHLSAENGPVDVGEPIIDMLFPPGSRSTVPIAAFLSSDPGPETGAWITATLTVAGFAVGTATRHGIATAGLTVSSHDGRGFAGQRNVLHDPAVDAAVFEISPEKAVKAGLGFAHCDVAIVAGDGKPPGRPWAAAARLLAQSASRLLVLCGGEEEYLDLAAVSPSCKICLIYPDGQSPEDAPIDIDREQVMMVFAAPDGQDLMVQEGSGQASRIPLDPACHGDNLHAAMAAVAVAYGLGVPMSNISQAARRFPRLV